MAADLEKISPKHRAIMRLMWLGTMNMTEIAAAVNMGYGRVLAITQTPLFQKTYKELEAQLDEGVVGVQSRFEELAPDAIETLGKLMRTSANENIQRQCAMDILKCAGHGNVQKFEVDARTSVVIPVGTINNLLVALKESESGPITTVNTQHGPELPAADEQSAG